MKRLYLFLLFFMSSYLVYSQTPAGSDKKICAGGSVKIGGTSTGVGECYSWKPEAGLDNPHILNPNASPAATTLYTLTIIGNDFSSKGNFTMTVTVLGAGDCCTANAVIAPTPNPTINNNAASNDCTPGSSTIAWDVCFDPNDQLWHVRVNSLTCAGIINIRQWPNQPTQMVVPNTANPVVGGNINNTAGSLNRWSYAISDMQDYNVAGGGAGPHWHSTAASSAHEMFHWNTDWLISTIGAFWPQAETDIEAFTIDANTKAAARAGVQAQVTARSTRFTNNTINSWNTTIIPADLPGAGGGAYAAGAAVLATLINAVAAFRIAQGW